MGITALQASRMTGLSTKTLALWADAGRIKATRTPAGWRLYDPADVERIRRELVKRK